MRLGPGIDAAHGDVFFLQLALLDQPAADGTVRVAVLVSVTDAQLAPAIELDTARALDLQELQVHRVSQPGQHRRLYTLAVDHTGNIIRLEGAAFDSPTQALALELRVDAVERDHDQIFRHAVDRDGVSLGLREAAGVDRLVVSGDQAVGRAIG
ncbi:hypothetical protein D3C76_825610 [compost metagenome]